MSTDLDLDALEAIASAGPAGPLEWINDRLCGPPRTVDYGMGPEEVREEYIETDSGVYPPHDGHRDFFARFDRETVLALITLARRAGCPTTESR